MEETPVDILPLNAAFALSKGRPVRYKGNLVYSAFNVDVLPTTRLRIDILKSRRPPEQVLQLIGDGCLLCIGQQSAKKGKVWISEWKKPIEITFKDVKSSAKLYVTNGTSDEIGQPINSWGNYGILIEVIREDQEWILRCCQGMMPSLPDFNMLVLNVFKSEVARLPIG